MTEKFWFTIATISWGFVFAFTLIALPTFTLGKDHLAEFLGAFLAAVIAAAAVIGNAYYQDRLERIRDADTALQKKIAAVMSIRGYIATLDVQMDVIDKIVHDKDWASVHYSQNTNPRDTLMLKLMSISFAWSDAQPDIHLKGISLLPADLAYEIQQFLAQWRSTCGIMKVTASGQPLPLAPDADTSFFVALSKGTERTDHILKGLNAFLSELGHTATPLTSSESNSAGIIAATPPIAKSNAGCST